MIFLRDDDRSSAFARPGTRALASLRGHQPARENPFSTKRTNAYNAKIRAN
jgi:hypothetical protein